MNDDEINKLSSNYIILDEFHRCGAKEWGMGIDRLLTAFSEVPILGLSVIAIYYLDNQPIGRVCKKVQSC